MAVEEGCVRGGESEGIKAMSGGHPRISVQ